LASAINWASTAEKSSIGGFKKPIFKKRHQKVKIGRGCGCESESWTTGIRGGKRQDGLLESINGIGKRGSRHASRNTARDPERGERGEIRNKRTAIMRNHTSGGELWARKKKKSGQRENAQEARETRIKFSKLENGLPKKMKKCKMEVNPISKPHEERKSQKRLKGGRRR